MTIEECLMKLVIFFEEYKGIAFKLNNGSVIYLILNPDNIPHTLGINRIPFFRRIRNSKNIYNWLINNGLNDLIYKNRSISKKDRLIIMSKLDSANQIIEFFSLNPDMNLIKIAQDVQFRLYKSKWVFSIYDALICLELYKFKNHPNPNQNFYSCFLIFIRNSKINEDKEYPLSIDTKLKIIEWHFVRKK